MKLPVALHEHALSEPASVDEKQQLQQQSGPLPESATQHTCHQFNILYVY